MGGEPSLLAFLLPPSLQRHPEGMNLSPEAWAPNHFLPGNWSSPWPRWEQLVGQVLERVESL